METITVTRTCDGPKCGRNMHPEDAAPFEVRAIQRAYPNVEQTTWHFHNRACLKAWVRRAKAVLFVHDGEDPGFDDPCSAPRCRKLRDDDRPLGIALDVGDLRTHYLHTLTCLRAYL